MFAGRVQHENNGKVPNFLLEAEMSTKHLRPPFRSQEEHGGVSGKQIVFLLSNIGRLTSDHCFQEWDTVLTLVEDAVTEFLVEHNFLNDAAEGTSVMGQTSDMESDESSGEMRSPKVERINRTLAFEHALPIKSAKAFSLEELQSTSASLNTPRPEFEAEQVEGNSVGEEFSVWNNPTSHGKYWIDRRTGNSYRSLPGQNAKGASMQSENNRVDKRSLRVRHLSSTANSTLNNLRMDDSLRKWNNPVFKRTERQLPSFTLPGESHLRSFAQKANQTFNGLHTEEIVENISKGSLDQLRVIAQVDNKFIAGRLAQTSSDTDLLVIIDQHAADERVRLEALLAELYQGGGSEDNMGTENGDEGECIVDVMNLDPPCRTTMQAREAQAALRHHSRYKRWGIFFSCPDLEGGADKREQALAKPDATVRIEVDRLPRLIADRCVIDPGVVRDLIRQHLYWLEEGAERGGLGSKCPRGILEILNSKACRSAIMFGDPLTKEECMKLINKLIKCKFPFQCAHGRPTMVPIAHIGKVMRTIRRSRNGIGMDKRSIRWNAWRKPAG
ncbi:hypothetical protein SpCBS45565_g03969 [Spizellomyces sp. 'palustris']|nr:hypothetical protein SpCBS45565_g03969 [Spizellomyces sp. 'palustris']